MFSSFACSLALVASLAMPAAVVGEGQEAKANDLPPLELYLLVGQSNMAGRGELETIDQTVHPRVFALGPDDTWQPAREPLLISTSKTARRSWR